MIKILNYLLEKVDNIHMQMRNLGINMETPKKRQLEKLEMKNMISEVRISFNGLISILDTKEIISKPEETLPIFLMPKPILLPL